MFGIYYDKNSMKIIFSQYSILFCDLVSVRLFKEKRKGEVAWTITTIPDSFKPFLGRITRNISISRFRAMHAKKRFSGMEVMLSELNDCIPSLETVENQVEVKQLSEYINGWLDDLLEDDQMLFIRRYWFGDNVQNLAKKCGITPAQMAQRMLKLRKSLKRVLEQKGVVL